MKYVNELQQAGMHRLGLAVCNEYLRTWTEGTEEEWDREKQGFLSDNPQIRFWYELADRIDLFDEMKAMFRKHPNLKSWRERNEVRSVPVIRNAYEELARWVLNHRQSRYRKCMRKAARLDNPDFQRLADRVRHRFWVFVNRETGIVESVFLKQGHAMTKLKISREEWESNSHPLYVIIKFN